jgi:DNA polymerase (family X)
MKGKLPSLVTDRDVRGILHPHTDLSDGVDTLQVMAEATRERGYQYFGVADHSQLLTMRAACRLTKSSSSIAISTA